MSNKEKIFGLIGYPLTHSFSQKYFTEKFEKEGLTAYRYLNFELKNITEFPDLINSYPNLTGLNVTIPYKKEILQYVDYKDDIVKKIGAANTLLIQPDKKIAAFNTDVYGFRESFKSLLKSHHKNALILGTGGAAQSVSYVLQELQIPFQFVSRNPQNESALSYRDLSKSVMKSHQIIINTTPVGMFPDTRKVPEIPFDFVTENYLFYDLIYNPTETELLRQAKNKGAVTFNGLKMLQLQAEKAWGIWCKKSN